MNLSFVCPRTCPLVRERWCRFRPILDTLGPVEASSHVDRIEIEVRSLDALALACQRCGLELVRDQTAYRWFGKYMGDTPLPAGVSVDQLGHCEHAIRVPGASRAYEIGVVARPEGGYTLLLDQWQDGYGLLAHCGPGADKLVREYAVAAIETAAAEQGWLCERVGDTVRVYHPQSGVLDFDATTNALETSGFTGGACHDAADVLLELLGRSTGRVATAEACRVPANVSLPS